MKRKTKVFIVALAALCIIVPSVYVAAVSYLTALVHTHGIIHVGAVTSMNVSVTNIEWGTIDPRAVTTITSSVTVSNTGNVAFNITQLVPLIGSMTPAWLQPFTLMPAAITPILVPAASSTMVVLKLSFIPGIIYNYMIANMLIGSSINFNVDFVIVTDGIVQA